MQVMSEIISIESFFFHPTTSTDPEAIACLGKYQFMDMQFQV